MSGLLCLVFTLFDRSSIQQDVRSALTRLYFIWQELIPTRCQVCSASFLLYLTGALSHKMSGLLCLVFTLFDRSSIPQDVRSALPRLYFIWQELYPTRCQVCSLSFLLYFTGAHSHNMSGLLCLVFTLFYRSSFPQDVRSSLTRLYFIWQELYPTRCQVCSNSSLLYLTGAHSHKMSGLLSFVHTLFYRSSFPQDVRSALPRLYFIWQELCPTRCQVCPASSLLYLTGALSNKMSGLLYSSLLYLTGAHSHKMSGLLCLVFTLLDRSSIPQDVRSALPRLYIWQELYPTRCQVCSASSLLYLTGALSNKMSSLLSFVFTLFYRSSFPQYVRSSLPRLYFILQELIPTRCQVFSNSSLLYLTGALSNKMSGLL